MELDKETERKLEAEDLERVGAWEPSIDPFQAVQTIPVSKIHHEKEALRAGKEEAIEHKGGPPGGEMPHEEKQKHSGEEAPHPTPPTEDLEESKETEPGLERHDSSEEPHDEGKEIDHDQEEHIHGPEYAHGRYPQFFGTAPEELSKQQGAQKTREAGNEIPSPPPVEGLKKRLGLHKRGGPGAPPKPPPIEGLHQKSRSKKVGLPSAKESVNEALPAKTKLQQRRHSHAPQQSTVPDESSRPSEAPAKLTSSASSSGHQGSSTAPRTASSNPPPTLDDKRLDQRFQLDVLKMRLQSALNSKDEVLKRWATHEALRDRNLAALADVRQRVVEHFEELTNHLAARDRALGVEIEARRLLDEAHSKVLQLEQSRAECEAKHLGEKQMCAELERRIKDHTEGISHAMALKHRRELEVKDLEIKVELAELELRHSDFDDPMPQLYHPDYTTKVQVPTRLPPGANPTDPRQLPMVSTHSTVSMESPVSEDEIVKSAIKHNVPLPSTVSLPKQIAAPPAPPITGHYVPNAPPVGLAAPYSAATMIPPAAPKTNIQPTAPFGPPTTSTSLPPPQVTGPYIPAHPSVSAGLQINPPTTLAIPGSLHSGHAAPHLSTHPPFIPPGPTPSSHNVLRTAPSGPGIQMAPPIHPPLPGPPPPLPPRPYEATTAYGNIAIPQYDPKEPPQASQAPPAQVRAPPTSIPIRFG